MTHRSAGGSGSLPHPWSLSRNPVTIAGYAKKSQVRPRYARRLATSPDLRSPCQPNAGADGVRCRFAFTNLDGAVELDEFKLKPGSATRADLASRRKVLKVPHPGAAN